MRGRALSFLICCSFILIPALAKSQPPEELFLPILINGVVGESSHYETVVRFVELSGTTADPAVHVDMEIFDNAGKPDRAFEAPIALHGSGSFHFSTAGYIDPPPPGFMDGWARLTVSGPGRLQATAEVFKVAGPPAVCPLVPICTRPSDLYISDAVIQAVKPAKVWRSAAVITAYRHTAFSVVNPSASDTAHVSIEVLRSDGSILQRGYTVDIPPMQRQSAFAWEWVAPPPLPVITPVVPPDSFYGSARIVSDVPVVLGVLQVLLPDGKLVSAVVTPEL